MKLQLTALLLALPLLAAAEPRDCLVVGVSDGDTITVCLPSFKS
ncbi:hypothetical protein [Variovorax sp. PAMC26660]|nr:hypothetical protein [Variovorax sp. PAMC26660]